MRVFSQKDQVKRNSYYKLKSCPQNYKMKMGKNKTFFCRIVVLIQYRRMEFSQTEGNYCHNNSPHNYFMSSKMPIKDHLQGLKSTSSSFKPNAPIDQKTKAILGEATTHVSSQHLWQIQTMKNMKLMKPKELHITNHQAGKENIAIGSHHERQTNAGFSRNALGGFFTS